MAFDNNAYMDNFGLGKSRAAPTVEANSLDPRYINSVQGMNRTAADYRKNLPGIQQQKINVAADASRMGLANAYANADKSANRRGMFYGGKRAGMRGQAESDVAADLSNKIRGINIETEGNAQGLEQAGIEGAFGLRNDQQNLYDTAYNEALSKRQQMIDGSKSVWNQAGAGTIGSLGGMFGGAQGSKSQGQAKNGVIQTDYSGNGTVARTG